MEYSRRQFLKITGATFAGLSIPGCALRDKVLHGADPDDPRFGYGKDVKTIPSYCGICFWKCGLLAHVVDGKVWKLTGNPADPLSRGTLCGRGTSGIGLLYDEDRLRHPLIRTGKGESSSWKQASWEQALDKSADLLGNVMAKYGPESIAVMYHGKPGDWFSHLGHALGTPNIGKPSDAQCRGPRDIAYWLTYGKSLGSPEPLDIENSKVLVLLGSHLGENMHVSQVREFATLVEKSHNGNAKIVVVDPRFSVAASKAWRYLPIRPGTDMALLLAWMNVLLHEGRFTGDLIDMEYLSEHAYGLPELKKHVKPFTPDWAYQHTGIEPSVIREVAHALADSAPNVLIHPGRFNARDGQDAQRCRAGAILNALLGSWGRKGGFFSADRPYVPPMPKPEYPHTGKPNVAAGKYFVGGKPPMSDLVNATVNESPYPIKAWIVSGTNFFHALPQKAETLKALDKLDALIVVDVLPSEPTGYADVVLPEATYLERHDDLAVKRFKPSYVAYRQPVIEPMYESKPGWWIAKNLGERLGVSAFFPWETAERMMDDRLTEAGIDPGRLKKEGVIEFDPGSLFIENGLSPVFSTSTGKIELFSTVLEEAGGEPLPIFRPPPPIKSGHYRLLTGRSPIHSFSRTSNNKLTTDLLAENELWINPRAARIEGVKSGDMVSLKNQDDAESRFKIKIRVTERIRPDCVYLIHGFGAWNKKLRRAFGKGASHSDLITKVAIDPVMGATGLGLNDVRILKEA